jgi:hypothetical protein
LIACPPQVSMWLPVHTAEWPNRGIGPRGKGTQAPRVDL